MANTQQQPPPPQEQQQSKTATQNAPVDQLQAMFNLIVVHSGRFIKEQQAGGGSGSMKQMLMQAVPVAQSRFFDALDDIELDVFRAQDVLRRDLALIKADRRKREAAAKQQEAEKARLAAESTAKQTAPPAEKARTPTTAATPPPELPAPAPEQQTAPPAPEPEALHREEDNNNNVPPPISTTHQPERDPLFDPTPSTANQEFDFDAIFGDSAMDTSNDNFTTGDNQNGGGSGIDTNMDALGDPTMSLDDTGPSLLRGLEDFAGSPSDHNGAGKNTDLDFDMDMPDLPDFTMPNTSSEQQQPSTSKPADTGAMQQQQQQPQQQQQQPPAPADNTDNPDVLGAMSTDDLEDLFNMGDYQNPEATQFDDAFFGFGEN